jgi:hypothetical protein
MLCVGVSVPPTPINFIMPEAIIMKLSTYIITPEPISKTY